MTLRGDAVTRLLCFLLNDRGQSPAGKRSHGTQRRAPWGRREGPWEAARPVRCENRPSELQDAVLICPGRPQTAAREQKARLL